MQQWPKDAKGGEQPSSSIVLFYKYAEGGGGGKTFCGTVIPERKKRGLFSIVWGARNREANAIRYKTKLQIYRGYREGIAKNFFLHKKTREIRRSLAASGEGKKKKKKRT